MDYLKQYKGEGDSLLLSLQEIHPVETPEIRDMVIAKRKIVKDYVARVKKARMAITKIYDAKKKAVMDIEKGIVADLNEELARIDVLLDEYNERQMEISNERRVVQDETLSRELQEAGSDIDKIMDAEIRNSVMEEIIDDAERGYIRKDDFEVVDFDKIPKLYLIVDEAAVKAAFKDGLEVPGIRYFQTAQKTGK